MRWRQRSRFRNSVYESLERRQVLTTYVVNTAWDDRLAEEEDLDGLISLREAVEAANSNRAFGDAPAGQGALDEIYFDPALNGQTITLDGRYLEIEDDLNIIGPGANLLTIDGVNDTQVFHISYGTFDVSISKLRVTGGTDYYGPMMENRSLGTVTVSECVAEGNIGSGAGAAIYNKDGALNIVASIFRDNSGSSTGGAIYNSAGVVRITDCTITDNSARGSGAIWNGGDMTIHNSVISHNTATANDSGGIGNSGRLSISTSMIWDNEALDGRGGGIFNTSSDAVLTIVDSTIAANRARTGGGIHNTNDSALAITNSTVSANVGAGIYNYNHGALTATNCTIVRNAGGGIWIDDNFSTEPVLNNCIVAGNFDVTVDDAHDIPTEDGQVNFANSRNNVIGDPGTSGGLADGANGNQVGDGSGGVLPVDQIVDLGLSDNGGPTPTHALVGGSPAIDRGSAGQAVEPGPDHVIGSADDAPLDHDQRGSGFTRIIGTSVDVGAFESMIGSVGDFVWLDANENGVQDPGEQGVPDVPVTLLKAGADGQPGTSDDSLVGGTVTDASGRYLFGSLAAGSYYLDFTLPANRAFTIFFAGDDFARDSNVLLYDGLTPVFTLNADDFDVTLDAGLVDTTGNANPQFSGFGNAIGYVENGAPKRLNGNANITDDSANFLGGSLRVDITSNRQATDRISILPPAVSGVNITVANGFVSHNGVSIGKVSGGQTSPFTVDFITDEAKPFRVRDLLRAIGYDNTGDAPSPNARTVSFTLTDGDGGTSNVAKTKVNVTPLNDAPLLSTAGAPLMSGTLEDALNPPGFLVRNLVDTEATDPDPGALKGIAITAIGGQATGQWHYSLNGGVTWLVLSPPSDSAARLLPADAQTRIRYLPFTNFNGNVGIWYRAWDRTRGSAGGTLTTVGNRGGTKTFSTALENALLNVAPVNDAPVLVSGTPALNSISEDAPNPIGTLVSNFASPKITDRDAGALKGIAVVGLTEKTRGAWQFSTNGGTSWTNLGSPSDTAARVLRPSDRVRFVPSANYFGTPQLKFRAWDQSNGKSAGSVVDTSGKRGGTGAYSTAAITAKLTVTPVNDKPVITLSGSVGYQRNAPAIFLASSALVADPDSPNFAGGQLRVRITSGGGTANTLAIGSGFTVDGSNVVRQGTTIIGTRVSNGVGTNELKVNFNSNATKAIVQQLVRAITYRNVGGSAGQRKIAFTVSDGDGGLSDVRTKTVNVT